jgi:hypothetical protein
MYNTLLSENPLEVPSGGAPRGLECLQAHQSPPTYRSTPTTEATTTATTTGTATDRQRGSEARGAGALDLLGCRGRRRGPARRVSGWVGGHQEAFLGERTGMEIFVPHRRRCLHIIVYSQIYYRMHSTRMKSNCSHVPRCVCPDHRLA